MRISCTHTHVYLFTFIAVVTSDEVRQEAGASIFEHWFILEYTLLSPFYVYDQLQPMTGLLYGLVEVLPNH